MTLALFLFVLRAQMRQDELGLPDPGVFTPAKGGSADE